MTTEITEGILIFKEGVPDWLAHISTSNRITYREEPSAELKNG